MGANPICLPIILKYMEKAPKNLIEEMKEMILESSKSIEAEFLRSPNPWLACFAGHLDKLEVYLSLSNKKGLFTFDEYKKLDNKIEDLKKEVYLLRKQYFDKDTIPPEEIKKELLKKLDIFQ